MSDATGPADGAQTGRSPGSLAASVHRRLKADILTCRLAPGAMLGAAQLAERFEVSRTPVHEALKHLCQEGLVRVVPRVGYVVVPVTLHDIDEIFGLRLQLEVHAAGRAAQLATDEDVAGLHAQHERALQKLKSPSWNDPGFVATLMAGNREFHGMVATMSSNHRLARLVGQLLDEGQRIYFLPFRAARPATRDDQHVAIIQALGARDPEAARAAMTTHILDMWEGTRVGSRLA